jgi:protein phosphatase 1 regulatory subunit 3A/B/C/D/E
MAEPSDQPPRLGPEIFKTITKGAEAEVTGLPPFKLNFTQPASDYLAFREKIDRNNVSLENAILRDYNLIGTVKVKNLSFEKRVYIRCTFDSWETSHNFEVKYVQPVGMNSNHSFDTFSFEFDISTEMDPHHTVQFAVCFETPSNQFWDNNNGQNYEITPTDFNNPFSNDQFAQGAENKGKQGDPSSWTEYNCWRHVDTSTPYY